MLSAERQEGKAGITDAGVPNVLDQARVTAHGRALFQSTPLPGGVSRTAPALPEPHASWVEPVEKEWIRRYGSGG